MLQFNLLIPDGVLVLEPDHALEAQDFVALSRHVDAYLSTHNTLKGVLIYTRNFPGWHDFSGFVSHMTFVRDHHRLVEKIALVTDAVIADVAKVIVGHFVHAEIKHFPYAEYAQALSWLESNSQSD